MKRIGAFCLMIGFLPLLSGCGVEKEKLHGTWVVEDGPPVTPKGLIMEFQADGKLRVGMMVEGKPITKDAGTWSVSGTILTTKIEGKEGKGRIKEVTADKLVIKDDEQPKDIVFKKQK